MNFMGNWDIFQAAVFCSSHAWVNFQLIFQATTEENKRKGVKLDFKSDTVLERAYQDVLRIMDRVK